MKAHARSPKQIMEIAFAFRRSKVLLTAVELGLFGTLARQPCDATTLAKQLGLHGRGAQDFFDALVALGMLTRNADGDYSNTGEAEQFLNPGSNTYIGDALGRVSQRVYPNWHQLGTALRSGQPQSGAFGIGGYEALYADARNTDIFLRGMTGTSVILANGLADAIAWVNYRDVVDVGCAEGHVSMQLACHHPHLRIAGFDLPCVRPAFERYVAQNGSSNLQFHAGDFHRDALPHADALIMSRILHNWGLSTKRMLLEKAYAALSPNGALIVCETLIDAARTSHVEAMLSSLHMLIETADGYEATAADYIGWMTDAGFRETYVRDLGCAQSAIVGIK